mmetsp:Transcript_25663/g.64765  ORF Transcript_25663/g.64765 Transcript_25663/m.64765 type:complete len:301 (+) Transcript_25663:156-1058(+)
MACGGAWEACGGGFVSLSAGARPRWRSATAMAAAVRPRGRGERGARLLRLLAAAVALRGHAGGLRDAVLDEPLRHGDVGGEAADGEHALRGAGQKVAAAGQRHARAAHLLQLRQRAPALAHDHAHVLVRHAQDLLHGGRRAVGHGRRHGVVRVHVGRAAREVHVGAVGVVRVRVVGHGAGVHGAREVARTPAQPHHCLGVVPHVAARQVRVRRVRQRVLHRHRVRVVVRVLRHLGQDERRRAQLLLQLAHHRDHALRHPRELLVLVAERDAGAAVLDEVAHVGAALADDAAARPGRHHHP